MNFEFEDVNKLIVWQTDEEGNVPDLRNLQMREASVLIDYVYLDSVERRRFAQVGHEYLIEQVQFTGDETITGNCKSSNIQYKSKLGFNHPCKELIWVVKNSTFAGDDRSVGAFGNGHPFLCYTDSDNDWAEALKEAANNIANGMIKTKKHESCNKDSNLCDAEVHINLNSPVVTADIATRPNHHIRFNIFVTGRTAKYNNLVINRYPLYCGHISGNGVSGFNFADHIDEVQVNVDTDTGNFVATVLSHTLTLTDVSVPTDSNDLHDCRYNTNKTGNPNDVFVIQHFNYGLRLDGRGNPVHEACLQLNGNNRFDPRHGSYFNYVQPWQYHTHTPADGVNVYSFALHPEQHQPSGTCNLSRIDNTVLQLTLRDPLRNCFGKCKRLSVDVADSKLFVYALNYNVLRIMSGIFAVFMDNILSLLQKNTNALVPNSRVLYKLIDILVWKNTVNQSLL